MSRRLAVVMAFLWSTLACAVNAAPVVYTLDTAHSRVSFYINHLGFSTSIGLFKVAEGRFVFDNEAWSQSTVDVSIPVSSLELGDATWNAHMLSAQWLDAAQFPQMRFVGKKVESDGHGGGKLYGELTLKGVTQPVVLDVKLNKLGEHPMKKAPAVGFTGTTIIHRSDFGMQSSLGAVGDDVQIRVEIEAFVPKA